MSTVLPTPAPPNRPILPPRTVRGEQVDDLDAGLEHLDVDRLVGELGRGAVDRPGLLVADRAGLIDRHADDVEDAAEHRGADRHRDGGAGVLDRLAADQAVGRVHGHAPHHVLTEVLRHLDRQVVLLVADGLVAQEERGGDLRQLGRVERDVDDRADDLDDATHRGGGVIGSHGVVSLVQLVSAWLQKAERGWRGR
jgi:hypothetical protein